MGRDVRVTVGSISGTSYAVPLSDPVGLSDVATLTRETQRTAADSVGVTDLVSASLSGSAGWASTVTHGDQLTTAHVGPWSIQGVSRGAETLQALTGPGRGYWTFASPEEFAPTGTYVYNNNTTNYGGIVPAGGMTIDGYSVPAGTYVIQFRSFPDGYDFYARAGGKFLFRGCKFRFSTGVSGPGLFNDSGAPSTQQIMMHGCDVGLTSKDPSGGEGLMHLKFLGGLGHRIYRGHHTNSSTFIQPNVGGCRVVETWIDDFFFAYGEAGTSGAGGSSILHLNGISSEGGLTDTKYLRNHILCPSPDGSTGSSGTAAGQMGYGTQSGQTGYGSGTNPGRLVPQTDCIAVFAITSSNNGVEIADNYLGGAGVTIYAGNADGSAQNIVVTGNKITTKYWTNGGNYGAITDIPTWGSNGNSQSNNTWADDYGTGGNGCTALANRQYPAGNGPRAGTSFVA